MREFQVQMRKELEVNHSSKEHELKSTKAVLDSELVLLRKQLTDSLEANSALKGEKDAVKQRLEEVLKESDTLKRDLEILKKEQM